jgi:integrase
MPISLYKRPRSPYWYFDVQVGSRRKRVSTKRTLKREAHDVAEAHLKTALDDLQHGRGVQELSLRSALFDHYLPSKKGAASYVNLERNARKVIGEYPGVTGVARADTPFHEITTTMLRQYRNRRKDDGVSPQTIDHEVKVVSAAYHLIKSDYRVRAGLEFPMERPKGLPRYLLPEEEAALLADLDPQRPMGDRWGGTHLCYASAQRSRQRQDNYDLAVMLLDTGARFGEIAKLTWDTVDTINWAWINILRTKLMGKGSLLSLQGQLSVTNRMREVLQRRYADRGNRHYIFAGWLSSGEDVPRGSTQAIRRAMARVGINHPAKVARFGRRDVRSLRDTFATKLRRAGTSLDRIQKLLGHASPVMTQKYADLAVDQASVEAADILNRLNAG